MASLNWTTTKQGKKSARIQFTNATGKRQTIYLGEMNKQYAAEFKLGVDKIVEARKYGTEIPPKVEAWASRLHDDFYTKLSDLGLLAERSTETLSKFLESYIVNRKELKASTAKKMRNTAKYLNKHFGESKSIRSITTGDADLWRQELVNQGLAVATISKMVIHARQFFKAAVRRGLANQNPFSDVKSGSQRNPERLQFIDRETIAKVLEACPSLDWRLIVCLTRFGGMRIETEALNLKLSDIDWQNDRITFSSPKTARQGKPYRTIPLFPELRQVLQEAWDRDETGLYVVAKYRTNQNVRTEFERILRRAGIKPWPKLFQNLRASRESELSRDFPLQTVTDWLGNSPSVALNHYLSTTEDDFKRAVQVKPDDNVKSNVTDDENEWKCEEPQISVHEKTPGIPEVSTHFDQCTDVLVPPVGVEHLRKTTEKQGFLNRSNVKSNVTRSKLPNIVAIDPDLFDVMKHWPSLSVEVREQVKALIVDAVAKPTNSPTLAQPAK